MKKLVAALCAALIAGACFGGRHTVEERIADHMNDARAAVREHVADTERAAALLGDLDRLEGLLNEQRESQAALTARLQGLNADPATTTAQLQAELDAFLAERRERRGRVLDAHLQLRERALPGEWEHIVKPELEALGLGQSLEEK